MQQAHTAKTPRDIRSFLAEVKGASVSGEAYVLEGAGSSQFLVFLFFSC